MNFLKNLFSGGGSASQNSDHGLYFYIRPTACEEVVQVRIDPRNDLSKRENDGYWVRKTVRGQHRCFNPADITLYFTADRKLESHDISGGELLDRAAYDEWQAAFHAKKKAASTHNAAIDAANQQPDHDTDPVE